MKFPLQWGYKGFFFLGLLGEQEVLSSTRHKFFLFFMEVLPLTVVRIENFWQLRYCTWYTGVGPNGVPTNDVFRCRHSGEVYFIAFYIWLCKHIFSCLLHASKSHRSLQSEVVSGLKNVSLIDTRIMLLQCAIQISQSLPWYQNVISVYNLGKNFCFQRKKKHHKDLPKF